MKANPANPGASEQPLRVLFIAAEADPLIKVGGLGDVAGSLPLALKNTAPEMDIRLAIPYYAAIHNENIPAKQVAFFPIASVNGPVEALVFETKIGDLPVYLIDGAPIAACQPVYGSNLEQDAEKFIFFSLACLYLPSHIDWAIDILHANDWHTAITIHELSLQKSKRPEFAGIKTLLTLHNLPFMGTGSKQALEKYAVSPARNPRMPGWARTLPLPMGLNASDKIVAVSPTYAREILTPEYGCDLQNFLQTRQKKLLGIVNGIDFHVWNPQDDVCLRTNYSFKTLAQRAKNKTNLQKEFELPQLLSVPLLTFIGRMDQQKGIDLAIEAMQSLQKQSWQAIFLGTGNKIIEDQVSSLKEQFPEQVRTVFRFDGPLSHRLYAGADMLLMPSRYEPCGLAQMIAMRYGCVPIARATGGLVDTIQDYEVNPEASTGFLYKGNDSKEFARAIQSAFQVYNQSEKWQLIQTNGMKQDNSWQNSAAQYYKLYRSMVKASRK